MNIAQFQSNLMNWADDRPWVFPTSILGGIVALVSLLFLATPSPRPAETRQGVVSGRWIDQSHGRRPVVFGGRVVGQTGPEATALHRMKIAVEDGRQAEGEVAAETYSAFGQGDRVTVTFREHPPGYLKILRIDPPEE